jgi:hypothetical protein
METTRVRELVAQTRLAWETFRAHFTRCETCIRRLSHDRQMPKKCAEGARLKRDYDEALAAQRR